MSDYLEYTTLHAIVVLSLTIIIFALIMTFKFFKEREIFELGSALTVSFAYALTGTIIAFYAIEEYSLYFPEKYIQDIDFSELETEELTNFNLTYEEGPLTKFEGVLYGNKVSGEVQDKNVIDYLMMEEPSTVRVGTFESMYNPFKRKVSLFMIIE